MDDVDVALGRIVTRWRQSVERAQGIERATAEQARGVRQVGVAMEQVRQMIDQILRATQDQRGGSESIMRTAERMRDLTNQVGRATSELAQGSRQIIQAVESTTEHVSVIVEATKEQAEGSQQIVDSIERISRIPRQTAGVAKVMAGAARDLIGEAGRFRETVRAYRTAERRVGGTALAFGVIPLDRADVMREKFKPLAEYLSRGLGQPVDLRVPDRYEACLRDIWEEETDFAYLTPTTYIEARHKFGVSLVSKALRNGLPFNHAAIVVPPGSSISRLEQIAGKRVAFGDERSTSSYLMPRLMLARAGVRLIDMDEYTFRGHHDRVAEAVLGGEADAGGMMESTARRFAERGLNVLAVSPDIPEFCVVAAAGTFSALGARDIAALPAQSCLSYPTGPSAQPGIVTAAIYQRDSCIDLTLRLSEQGGIGLAIDGESDGAAAYGVIQTLCTIVPAAPITLYVAQSALSTYQEVVNGTLAWNERISISADNWTRWIAGARGATLDLLEGRGTNTGPRLDWRAWRWPLVLAAAVLLINVSALNIEWWRMKSEANTLRSAMTRIYRSAYPNESVIIDPLAQMQQKISIAKRYSGLAAADDFTAMTAPFGEAWAGVTATLPAPPSIAALEYRDRSLSVRLRGREAPTQQMKAALAERDLSLELAPEQSGTVVWKIRGAK